MDSRAMRQHDTHFMFVDYPDFNARPELELPPPEPWNKFDTPVIIAAKEIARGRRTGRRTEAQAELTEVGTVYVINSVVHSTLASRQLLQ